MADPATIQQALSWDKILIAGNSLISIGALVFYAGSIHQRIKSLTQMFSEHRAEEAECERKRETNECRVNLWVTRLQDRVSRLEGREQARATGMENGRG